MRERSQIVFGLALLGTLLTAFGVSLVANFLLRFGFLFLEWLGDHLLEVTATVIALYDLSALTHRR